MTNNADTMQISVESMEGLQRRMSVTVAQAAIAEDVTARLEQISKTARIDGFRKGKVPISVVKRQYGEAVYAEVINNIVRKTLEEAIEKESLNPAGYPKIESIDAKKGESLNYSVLFDVYPDIVLDDFAKLNVIQQQAVVTDKDIEETLNRICEQSATWQVADAGFAARQGDQLTIDFVGTLDGEIFPGGSGRDHKLELGSKSFIPGFEDQLIGICAGDDKVVKVTFPEEYHSKDLAGKAAEFAVTVQEVACKQLPEMDDPEFIVKFFKEGEDANIDKLKQNIKNSLERELTHKLRMQLKQHVFDELATPYTFDVPVGLVDAEIDRRVEDFQQQFTRFMTSKDQSMPDVDRELFRDEATKQVKLGLILSKIAEEFSVKAERDDVREYLKQRAQDYDDPEAFVQSHMQDPNQLKYLHALVVEEKLVDLILQKANVEQKTVSYEEVVNPQKEQDA